MGPIRTDMLALPIGHPEFYRELGRFRSEIGLYARRTVREMDQARAAGNYEESDRLRALLEQEGVHVMQTKDGTDFIID